jgi:glutathione S-transferase
MTKLKLYGGAKNRGRRCYWLAKELGLDIEPIEIDLHSGQHKSPDFLLLNPNGQVPVLDDGGLILYESFAINLYLAKQYGTAKGSPLAPRSPQEEALMTQWSFWVVNEVEHLQMTILQHRLTAAGHSATVLLPEEARDAKRADEAWEKLQKPLGILDATLTGRDYLVGDRFTVADLNVAIVFSTFSRLDLELTRFPNLRTWLDTCLGRPAGEGFV